MNEIEKRKQHSKKEREKARNKQRTHNTNHMKKTQLKNNNGEELEDNA